MRRSPDTLALLALALAAPLAACSMAGETTGATSRGSDGFTTSDGTTTTEATGGAATDSTGGSASATSGADLCGNGAIDAGEVCDGAALGGQTCAGLGAPYVGGELGCADDCAAFDASGCEVDAAAPKVRLNEILAKGASAGEYAGKGDLVELVNVGAAPADLSGWRLSDEAGLPADKTYVFPPGRTLAPGEFLVLVEYDAMTGEGQLPFGVSSSNAESLVLVDAADVVVDEATFEGADAALSWCRIPDGEGAWATCAQTPGASNDPPEPETCGDGVVDAGEECDGEALGGKACVDVGAFGGGELACAATCLFDTSGCLAAAMVVLNEVSSSDLDPIELVNAGGVALDLSGWILTDDPTEPYDPAADLEELVFPPGTSLAAGAYLVVEKGAGALQHPFGLSAGGDAVRLFDADLKEVDAVAFGADEAAVSYCRLPDGPEGAWGMCSATFGAANQP